MDALINKNLGLKLTTGKWYVTKVRLRDRPPNSPVLSAVENASSIYYSIELLLNRREAAWREAAWYIIFGRVYLSVYQPQAITFESLDTFLYICTSGVSPGNTCQVRRPICRSSGQGQGHKSKKVENPYSRSRKLPSAITPVF